MGNVEGIGWHWWYIIGVEAIIGDNKLAKELCDEMLDIAEAMRRC